MLLGRGLLELGYFRGLASLRFISCKPHLIRYDTPYTIRHAFWRLALFSRRSYSCQPDESSLSERIAYNQFRTAISRKDARGIRTAYPSLPPIITGDPQSKRDVVIQALSVLAMSGGGKDRKFMERILAHMPTQFGSLPDARIYDTIFSDLLKVDIVPAHAWLRMGHPNSGYAPTLDHWHALLLQCCESQRWGFALNCISEMRALGCPPTVDTAKIYLRSIFAVKAPRPPELINFIELIKKEMVPFDEYLLQIIVDGYTDHANLDDAVSVESFYKISYGMTPSTELLDAARTKRLVMAISDSDGFQDVRVLYETFRAQGFQASEKVFLDLLDEETDTQVLKFWEKTLDIDASGSAWAKIIRNKITIDGVKDAISAYEQALAANVIPTSDMLIPIIRVLCLDSLERPRNEDIDLALRMFQDFLLIRDEPEHKIHFSPDSERNPMEMTRHDPGIARLYNMIIYILTSSNEKKFVTAAVSLIEHMQARGVRMDYMTATSVVILLMRSCSTVSEAFNIYRLACRSTDGRPVLDQIGYGAVLDAFCKLPFAINKAPRTRLYFEIVQDMRKAGYRVTIQVYTIILRQLGALATRVSATSDSALREAVIGSIVRTHNYLNVDASITPDTMLWNQLMDTYQRAGCYAEAMTIWKSLYLSREFDHASVSIILDTCAFAGADSAADGICDALVKEGFPLNQRNWNNWLECLCRLGRIDDAVRVLCLDMKSQPGVAPDEEGIRIILKFVSHKSIQWDIRSRLRRYLPNLWNSLPPDLQRWN